MKKMYAQPEVMVEKMEIELPIAESSELPTQDGNEQIEDEKDFTGKDRSGWGDLW